MVYKIMLRFSFVWRLYCRVKTRTEQKKGRAGALPCEILFTLLHALLSLST